jgi:hypothetical protein
MVNDSTNINKTKTPTSHIKLLIIEKTMVGNPGLGIRYRKIHNLFAQALETGRKMSLR